MASTDSLADVTGFAKQNNANFPVLSDPDQSTAEAYGVRMSNGMATRWTYYIGKDGVIDYIDKSVSVRTAGEDMAKKLDELGYEKALPPEQVSTSPVT